MREKITFKKVMDSEGFGVGVELWQGGQHIFVTFETGGTHKNGYRWEEIVEVMEHLSKQAARETNERLGEGMEWLIELTKEGDKDGK